ncbi:AbrB/MazE/SpoVT family DNA-binding domain-containing protein [Pseudomonas sp. NPDC090203]|uniref:AbrB/MazE/SpoVT family DNA-binding domain-containing protein n=1 Tax=unclassified Pseudomonas TaxID=196821 RepID=UPI0037FFC06F
MAMVEKRKTMTMNSTIRRQGGAAVMTIPPAFLRLLDLDIGSQVELSVEAGGLIAKPVPQMVRKRYSAAELLKGAEHVAELNSETAWAREGDPIGREII